MTIDATALEGLRRRNWNLRSVAYPETLSRVPTMLTPEECRMLAWVAQVFHSGRGAVCDLGSFLGGSTAHLAYGISQSRVPGTVVDAFDQFTIADEHKQHWLYDWGYPQLKGNDMLPLFERFVDPFGPVRPHVGMLEDKKWDKRPIGILFVDIMKGWSTSFHVMREFYPSLQRGSVVIHQDIQHYLHPWAVATTEHLSDHLELVSWTEENSAIYLCTQPITPARIEQTIEAMSDINLVYSLIAQASDRFPYARQREAVWQNRQALARNPSAQFSWELSLG